MTTIDERQQLSVELRLSSAALTSVEAPTATFEEQDDAPKFRPTIVLPAVSARSRRLNRLVDVVVSAAMLLLLAPVMAVIAVAVRLTSSGPAIFRQQRVGRGGVMFDVLKFRTMRNGTHAEVLADPGLRAIYEQNDFKLPGDDPRITRLGRFLRRTSLDELPQLVNVLKGEMGLVGVRPIELEQLEARPQYDQDLYRFHRPALTGLWQVEGRSAYRDTHRVELDRKCLEQWSVRVNARILVRTPMAVLHGSGRALISENDVALSDDAVNPPATGALTRIGVVGTGYVGLTTGACFAHLGHHVVCGDIDARKIDLLNAGHIPIVEDGLEQIVLDARSLGRLEFVLGAEAAAEGADIVFLCVPTPQGDDGSADLSYIEAAAAQIGPLLKPGAVVVNKSTVPVGSTLAVERVLGRDDVFVVSNPEFLREGTAVKDFLQPDRVVIGAKDRAAAERVGELYAGIDTPVLITDPASAETIKYAANGFLAMKISFVNAVAAMCEAVGADVAAVVDGIGSDQRIGRRFLSPGPGWGGSCFPKDSRALVRIAEEHGYNFSMMRGVVDVNDEQRHRMVDKVARAVGRHHSDLSGVTVGAMGLTFKAGTDDLRESPALAIIAVLRNAGAVVRAFDPTTCGELAPHQQVMLEGVELVSELIDVADGADVLCVFTEWPEFTKIDLDEVVSRVRPGTTLVDMRNLFDPADAKNAGLRYDGVGRR